MQAALKLDKMTRTQKLKVMEDLWADLSHEEGKFRSPAWHAEALAETEAGIKDGKVAFTDWETAKTQLRLAAK